ncbi:2-succinyl-6-hydroxy-2,4-cyclohexadiene-1-carboxylate synthase [Domibacillus iocasae]|uniref:Putative 2-succinyl-6-hydroxy-2,4-cyclohexadiene-1-carboxylate synthase n=1 Tax=Domibacillus iocasae TaxID=1714016 RepID=A0A1E7DLZ6_9BACI|nr:2-succinyl-6-hydroxy-2,4-cyclohexadiene-1-carboxylate synthase [Domibacillus iocasae]OES44083.1 2-succinyl-6-hydroxy-2,4-cyclohexadiene-1-carboxylate synthase [Domibacillus iocasae]
MTFFFQIEGKGEPVLFLHGFTGSSRTWAGFENPLPFQLVMPDLAGHGRTTRLSSSLEAEASALKKMMTQQGFASFHLVGYSMGGRLALALALLYPEAVRSLILESASPGLESKQERAERKASDEKLAQRIEKDGIAPFVDFWENIPMFSSQKSLSVSIREMIRSERLNQSSEGLASSLRQMGTGSQSSYWQRLSNLQMPVLLLTGTRDEKFTQIACQMSSLIPFCEWIEFEGAGHAIHVEQREKFGTIVKKFLLNIKGGQQSGS